MAQVTDLAVVDAKTGLSLGTSDGQLKVWTLNADCPTQPIVVSGTKNAFRRPPNTGDEPERPTCLAVSADGQMVAVGTDEGAVLIYELKQVSHLLPPCT